MDGPGHNPGGWPGAQSVTNCASCGSSVPPGVARCPKCGRPRDEDSLTVLGDTPLPTPLPSSPADSSDEVTRFAVPSDNVKPFVGPEDSADDVTRIVTAGDAAEDVTRFVAPSEAPEDVTRFVPADDALTVAASDTPADAMTVAAVTSATAGARRARRTNNAGPLEVGQSFGPRYHIIRLLGAGGMGAVYQAWDAELGVAVAIKVIRPEVMEDPATAEEVGRRFKRELLLARQVTHKNVVRIHDIGDIDGIKYITMSYVEGTDLASILKKDGKRPIPELLGIARSVIGGLVAAHSAGVVHRDLKPANIMISKEGEALIMDFGIAHSTGDAGAASKPGAGVGAEQLKRAASLHAATTLGSIVGTVEYMAPEQARGQAIDQRVDVYAFGLILYDALLGQRRASSGAAAVEELQRRMSAPPPPLQALAPDIPAPLAALIARCVEPEADKRFQTSADVAAQLDRLDENGHQIAIRKTIGLPLMASIVAVLLAAVAGTWYYWQSLVPPPARDPVLVAIADFDNTTGDPAFDRTIEPIVRRGLEDAAFINAYDRTRLQSTFGIQPPPRLDEKEARLVAANQGLGVVLAGSVSRQGTGFGIAVKAIRVATGEVIVDDSRRASSKDQVLEETARLIAAVRKALGDTTSDSDQLFAMRTMTATRLDVARYYAAAFEAQSNGNYDEAIKNLRAAIDLDPKTSGLGYQGLAILSRNLDRIPEAEEYIKQALNHLDGMTRRESLATRGVAYIIQGNPQRCVEEYGRMLETFAADAIARNQRALCLSKLRKLTEAVADMRQAVRLVPKRALFRANLAVYAAYGSQFQVAEQEAKAVTEPFDFATLALAFAQLGRGSAAEATQTYQKLATLGTRGASWSSAGLGDLALYEGRYQDAIRIFEDGAKADLAAEFPERAARKYISIGQAHLLRNEPARATTAAARALQNSNSMEVRFLAARVFVAAGDTAKAEPIAAALVKELPAEPHTYGKILQGEIALKNGNLREAIALLTEANDPNKGGLDTWLGHFALGQAYLAGEQFLDADSEFDLCIRRKGEALSVLVDESPSFGYLPVVYYYQGQVREAMKTSGFAASYREYVKIRGSSTEDRLVAEARRRAG